MANRTDGVRSASVKTKTPNYPDALRSPPPNYVTQVQKVRHQAPIDVDDGGWLAERNTKQQEVKTSSQKYTGGVIGENLDYVGNKTSMLNGELTSDVGSIPKPTAKAPEDKIIDHMTEQNKQYRYSQVALAAAKMGVDIMNANSAYDAVKGTAVLNIMQSRNQANDAIYRGRQAQSDAELEGYNAGEDATLAMAAQGQDVQGAGVQKVKNSFEAMGIMNGMQEEINSIREALGFELEEINYKYQVKQAAHQRDTAIIGSALNFGTSALAGYYGG